MHLCRLTVDLVTPLAVSVSVTVLDVAQVNHVPPQSELRTLCGVIAQVGGLHVFELLVLNETSTLFNVEELLLFSFVSLLLLLFCSAYI